MRETDDLNAHLLRLKQRVAAAFDMVIDFSAAVDKGENTITAAPLAGHGEPQRPRAVVDMEALGRELGKPAAVKP